MILLNNVELNHLVKAEDTRYSHHDNIQEKNKNRKQRDHAREFDLRVT